MTAASVVEAGDSPKFGAWIMIGNPRGSKLQHRLWSAEPRPEAWRGGGKPHQVRLGPSTSQGVLDGSDLTRDFVTDCQLASKAAKARNTTSPKHTRGLDDCWLSVDRPQQGSLPTF